MSTLRFGRYTVETTNEQRVLFPDAGCTKGDLLDYYRRVGPVMIRYLQDRPLSMHRFPSGIKSAGFYQQKSEDYFPDWIETVTVAKEGGDITHALCNRTATLVYLAQLGTVTPHVWLSRVDRLHQPDQLVIDLDPPSEDAFDRVREAAFATRYELEARNLAAFVMTTGSKGLHVRAPIRRQHTFDEVRAYLHDLAANLAERHPDALTTEQRKDRRRGRIYIDVSRVAYAQTAVPPYAVRARAGAPVATPITWDELRDQRLTSSTFTMADVLRRLDEVGDSWSSMFRHARSLTID